MLKYKMKTLMILIFMIITLSTYVLSNQWDISTLQYVFGNYSLIDSNSQAIFFNASGNKMFITGSTRDNVTSYTLSKPWNISTAVMDHGRLLISARETNVRSLFIDNNGSHLYIAGVSFLNVTQYNLATPWNVTTGSYVATNKIVPWGSTFDGLVFSPNGSYMYAMSIAARAIMQYGISPPWNIMGLSYIKNYTIGGTLGYIDMFINPTGSKVYLTTGTGNGTTYKYTMSVPWEIDSLVDDSISFEFLGYDLTPSAIFINGSGNELFFLGTTFDKLLQFHMADSVSPQNPNITANVTVFLNSTRQNIVMLDSEAYPVYYVVNSSAVYINLTRNGTEVSNNSNIIQVAGYYNYSATIAQNDSVYFQQSSLFAEVVATINPCTCPTSGDFLITNGNVCNLTTSCNIGNNNLRIENGILNIEGSGILNAAKCTINYVLGKLRINALSGAKLTCNLQ
jgi:hypothetical protein